MQNGLKRAAILAATGALVLGGGVAPTIGAAAVDATQGVQRYRLSTAQSEFTSGVRNQGWWSTSTYPNQDSNDNYVVGHFDADEFRDFFSFDLAPVDNHILSATLVVRSGHANGDPVEQLSLFDVSTPAETVNINNGANPEIFADLGTGTNYGDFAVKTGQPNQWLRFPLNPAAIRDLNKSTGEYFTLGGRLTSADHRDGIEAVFSSTGKYPARLIVHTTP